MSLSGNVRLRVRSTEHRVTRGRQARLEQVGDAREYVIGSSDYALLQCSAEGIEDLHCVVTVQGNSVTVRDLNSRTGVFVNGQQIQGVRRLRDADHLRVGPLELMVEIEADVDEDPVYQEPSADREGEQISRWLVHLDESDWQQRRKRPELRRFEDTEAPQTAKAEEEQPSAPPSAPAEAPAAAANEPRKPGKLPVAPKTIAPDSVNAAELALRKLGVRPPDVLKR